MNTWSGPIKGSEGAEVSGGDQKTKDGKREPLKLGSKGLPWQLKVSWQLYRVHRHYLHRAVLEEDEEVFISAWRFKRNMVRLRGVQAASRHMISRSLTAKNVDCDLRKSLPRKDSSRRAVPRLIGPQAARDLRTCGWTRGSAGSRYRPRCWDRRSILRIRDEEAWRGTATWSSSEKNKTRIQAMRKARSNNRNRWLEGVWPACSRAVGNTGMHVRRNHATRSSVGSRVGRIGCCWLSWPGTLRRRSGWADGRATPGRQGQTGQRPWTGKDGWTQCEERHILVRSQGARTEDCQKSLGIDGWKPLPDDPNGV